MKQVEGRRKVVKQCGLYWYCIARGVSFLLLVSHSILIIATTHTRTAREQEREREREREREMANQIAAVVLERLNSQRVASELLFTAFFHASRSARRREICNPFVPTFIDQHNERDWTANVCQHYQHRCCC
jgi:hypothetical protein